MVESLPRFNFELVKQGIGNPITFKLSDITDAMRLQLQNYSLANSNLRYWSFEIEEWFASDPDLNDYSIYHLCIQYPNSQTFAGHIQNVALPALFGNSSVLLASSGVEKSIATGTPHVGGKGSGEFVFARSSNAANAATFNTDDITLVLRDQSGNAVGATCKIKYKLRYKEYVAF